MTTLPPCSVGLDIGGTHLRAALVDAQGELLHTVKRRLQAREPDAMLAQMEQARAELRQHHGALDQLPMGVGLAAQIWIARGVVAVAPNLGWHDVPFGDMLRSRFGERVRLVNDLNAIAVGEAACGATRGCKQLCCVFVGTGTGMGAVVGGEVVEGADGLATELGHTKVASVVDGRRCGCGERGCLEAYTSGRHLPELWQAKVDAGIPSTLQPGDDNIHTPSLDAAAAAGDAAAQALWQDVGTTLAQSIGNVVTLFNPAVLVLGGGVLGNAPNLKRRLVEQIRDYAARPALRQLQITDTALGDNAGIIGAALLAYHPPQSARDDLLASVAHSAPAS